MWRIFRRDENGKEDRLLAQGKFSGPEKDRIFQQIILSVTREKESRAPFAKFWRPAWVSMFAVAAAVPVFIIIMQTTQHTTTNRDWRSKGSRGQRVVLEMGCAEDCRVGSTLMFRVQGLSKEVYVAAYAEDEQKRIWYFPDDEGHMPHLHPKDNRQIVARGVRIGNEHSSGTYTVSIFLTPRSYNRHELSSAVIKGEVAPISVQRLRVLP